VNLSPVLEALVAGAVFGLSAGLAPGPLLALVISQALRHGARDGVRVAMAPLLTDVPIVTICTVVVATMAASAPASIGLIALAGAAMVAWLAWDTWRSEPPAAGPDALAGSLPAPVARSWTRGALVNALSPHPWLFWLLVGSPALLAAWSAAGLPAAGAFLAGFYGCLVGSKAVIALAVARARGRIAGRPYRWAMRGLGVLLALFALGLLVEGVSTLASLIS
jgi:threonine/homoserine/homoserine lactone efflux protein